MRYDVSDLEWSVITAVTHCRGRAAAQGSVTVRRRVGNDGGRNVAAGAGAVLDYDRLAEPLLKSGGHCAHHDVDAAAGHT